MSEPLSNLLQWLLEMVARKGSDIYLTYGAPPMMRGDRGMEPLADFLLDDAMLSQVVNDITTPDQQGVFEAEREFNMSVDLGPHGRFRVNIYRQRQHAALVIRQIVATIPTLTELGLPEMLGRLCCERRGLVIVVGATGSGKSTSLAAMIDYRNSAEEGHIITIEDPLEYVHEHKRCLVSQREVGTDTKSFEAALKNALRQKPDVILVGEIRDAETMRHAINIAETGHLALATLHANNANQALDRILSFFDRTEHAHILLNLSMNLRGIMSQRLVRTLAGPRVAVLEILLNRAGVPELVRRGDTHALKAEMAANEDLGMQTFDQALLRLWEDGIIADHVAIAEADDPVALRTTIENA